MDFVTSQPHRFGAAEIRPCPVSARFRQNRGPQAHLPLAFFRGLRYHMRMTDNPIESLARKLADSLPQGLRSVRDDVEENFRSVLRSGLSKLDLVTREEFEVQEAVLARTREKLEALEKRLEDIES